MTDNAASIEATQSESEPADTEDGEHLREIPTGAGCTEIWEKLSEQREENDDAERTERDADRADPAVDHDE